MRNKDGRQYDQCSEQQPPVDESQNAQAADQLHNRAPGVVEESEDEIADGGGVFTKQARHSSRLEFLNSRQRESYRVFKELLADVELQPFRRSRGCPTSRDM